MAGKARGRAEQETVDAALPAGAPADDTALRTGDPATDVPAGEPTDPAERRRDRAEADASQPDQD